MLYKLGCDRGFLVDDLTYTKDTDDQEDTDDQTDTSSTAAQADSTKPGSCWTVIYSATSKDGSIKTGEAYSNAGSSAEAKEDVKTKLSGIGYSNISILAIENCNSTNDGVSFSGY